MFSARLQDIPFPVGFGGVNVMVPSSEAPAAERETLKKIPASRPCRGLRPRFVVNSSMSVACDPGVPGGFSARHARSGHFLRSRHGTCLLKQSSKNHSRSRGESVNFSLAFAKPSLPSGGIQSSHGHSGRSVGRFRFLSSVVQRLPGGHPSRRSPLSRGPGLLAALTTRDVGFGRMPAPAGRTAPATRRRSPVVNRAVPTPAIPAGTSGGWMGRTRTGPRTRLRRP